jgi:hypothetical protein
MKIIPAFTLFVLFSLPAVNFSCTISCYFKFHNETLFDAVYYSDIPFIKAYRGDMNLTNKSGQTALMFAAGRGQAEIVRILISEKADINTADKSGATALSIAVQNRNEAIINLLKKDGEK